jgi:hypothetical protein
MKKPGVSPRPADLVDLSSLMASGISRLLISTNGKELKRQNGNRTRANLWTTVATNRISVLSKRFRYISSII